ncbi:MAG TPA: DNA-processing protein DprA [Syntrophorhabdaceae bacterium]|mgnify:CR=1 FL=1|nr:DNA-processing protein DprA [Syntrophorhabdaceae bacterium]HQM80155.1 DNA-processing protein DprA [Syntrophorhabdaceae bacterium]
MDERTACIALSRIEGLNNFQKREIAFASGEIGPLFEGKRNHCIKGLTAPILSFRDWKGIGDDLKALEKMGADVLTIKDEEYPQLLREIPDAPVVLYRKGPLPLGANTLAIVGSRKASFEGMNLAEKIAETLSAAGITIVSGLARGIDAAAHKGALKGEGKTIGVLGCGIDICYPAENKRLFERMGDEAAVLTEYMPGEKPLHFHFPERNRIIAGLARGVLVIEASQRSGSLITARLGLEYGREVMAVPGSVFNEEYRGANMLIKEGARLVDGIGDIVTTCFPGIALVRKENVELDANEKYIYGLVGFQKVHIDEVIEKSAMEAKQVMAVLTQLEMKETIRQLPGGFYIKTAHS